jgi:maleate cis-trans isomerase
MAKEMDGPDVDGVFLSCTNTTQIEAIADIERQLGKPVVNSNRRCCGAA